MPQTLNSLSPGDRAVVNEINCEPEAKARLMEMGLLKGTPIRVVKFAPLGDPVEVELRGYHLSLRRAEAAAITVD